MPKYRKISACLVEKLLARLFHDFSLPSGSMLSTRVALCPFLYTAPFSKRHPSPIRYYCCTIPSFFDAICTGVPFSLTRALSMWHPFRYGALFYTALLLYEYSTFVDTASFFDTAPISIRYCTFCRCGVLFYTVLFSIRRYCCTFFDTAPFLTRHESTFFLLYIRYL